MWLIFILGVGWDMVLLVLLFGVVIVVDFEWMLVVLIGVLLLILFIVLV